MQKTEHFQLNQWDPEDSVLRADFNADNARLDAALAACGNCRVEHGTYVGRGTSGPYGDDPCTLTFAARPLMVAVLGPKCMILSGSCSKGISSMVSSGGNGFNKFSWKGNTLEWYSDGGYDTQLNQSGVTYDYLAFYLNQ